MNRNTAQDMASKLNCSLNHARYLMKKVFSEKLIRDGKRIYVHELDLRAFAKANLYIYPNQTY